MSEPKCERCASGDTRTADGFHSFSTGRWVRCKNLPPYESAETEKVFCPKCGAWDGCKCALSSKIGWCGATGGPEGPGDPPDPHCEHGYDVQEAICPVCKTGEHAHPPKPPCGCCVFDEKYKSWVFDCECRNYDDNARAAGWCAEQNVTAPLQAEIKRLTSEIEGHKNSALGLNITISLQAKEIERLTAELDRRYKFIGRYADHDRKCIDYPGDKCICGYHERLMALRPAVEGQGMTASKLLGDQTAELIERQRVEIERLMALLAHERCIYQNGGATEKPPEDLASPYGADGSPIECAVLRREWHAQKAEIEGLTRELDEAAELVNSSGNTIDQLRAELAEAQSAFRLLAAVKS